ncbi:ABC transporter permease [Euzebya pacifica]|uniref:ABC transporter permease n=1 Tax=Euzebya pacifica TaxID=1608957 RepID=UPI0030FD067B
MTRYALKRVVQTIPTLIGISLAAFLLVRLTGDPAVILLPTEASPEAVAEFRTKFGLDESLPVQYWQFLRNTLQGDLGTSIRFNVPVLELFLQKMPATVELAVASITLSMLAGIPMGVLSGLKHRTLADTIIRGFAFIGQAIPGFYLGLLLIIGFAVKLRWLPTGGRGTWQQLVLPTVTLSVFLLALLVRFTRGAVLDAKRQPHVVTAESKGLSQWRVLRSHILKNSMIPIITVIGLQVGAVLSGTVVTEVVFNWPGIGRLMVDAIYTRDFPVVQAMVMIVATIFIVVNLVVDILYSVFDPRIRQG